MSIYEDILNYLESLEIANVRRFFPFYICSGGAHLFNRFNRQRTVVTSHGLPIDLRMHLFFVSQPGFSKTFSMRVFSNPVYGIFSRTDINPAWEDRMTEARFSGTIYQDQRGVVKQVYGAAYEYSNCILCVDEFHALANTMTQQHSSTLESALCTALDSGWVRKGLGRGKLEYQTSVTMWAGAQPMRYDLGQGTGRRFVFLEFIPSEDDEETIRQAMRRGKNVKHDMLKLNAIRRDIRNLWTDINRIDNVWFNPEIDRYYDRIKIMPYEEHLFNVIAIGYNIMHGDVKRDFEINIDDELKRLFDLENEWRHDIKKRLRSCR